MGSSVREFVVWSVQRPLAPLNSAPNFNLNRVSVAEMCLRGCSVRGVIGALGPLGSARVLLTMRVSILVGGLGLWVVLRCLGRAVVALWYLLDLVSACGVVGVLLCLGPFRVLLMGGLVGSGEGCSSEMVSVLLPSLVVVQVLVTRTLR